MYFKDDAKLVQDELADLTEDLLTSTEAIRRLRASLLVDVGLGNRHRITQQIYCPGWNHPDRWDALCHKCRALIRTTPDMIVDEKGPAV